MAGEQRDLFDQSKEEQSAFKEIKGLLSDILEEVRFQRELLEKIHTKVDLIKERVSIFGGEIDVDEIPLSREGMDLEEDFEKDDTF